MLSKKHRKVSKTLKYVTQFLILASTILISTITITSAIFCSAFSSLAGIPVAITSSATGLKTCATTAGIKISIHVKKMSIHQKKKKKHDKIVLLATSKLNSIEALVSRVLTDSFISQDDFVLINDVLKEYNKMEEEIKNLEI